MEKTSCPCGAGAKLYHNLHTLLLFQMDCCYFEWGILKNCSSVTKSGKLKCDLWIELLFKYKSKSFICNEVETGYIISNLNAESGI